MLRILWRFMRTATGRLFERKSYLLELLLNNTTQGVVMFDALGRLVFRNDQYVSMYGLARDVVKPGASLLDIVADRVKSGSLNRDPKQYVPQLLDEMAAGQDRQLRRPSPGRARDFGHQPGDSEQHLLGRHPRGYHRAPRGGAKERVARRAGSAPRRHRGRHCVVSRRHRGHSGDRRRQRRGDEIDRDAAFGRLQPDHGAHHGRGRDDQSGLRQRRNRLDRGGRIVHIDRRDQPPAARAAEAVNAAAAQAQSTNQDITDLAQAAQKIDDVVKLIQSVAGQTNLLALNATIEAARAGAAGKGFAVVASEVKALAVQTAKATDVIAGQIAAVQSSTQSAVRAMGDIAGRMQEVRLLTAAIANSVEQQNAATCEISTNVAAAATGTKSVVAVLERVAGATSDMRKSADTVLTASQAVEAAAASLRGSVDGFLRKVAT